MHFSPLGSVPSHSPVMCITTHDHKTNQPTFWGGANISEDALKDVGTLFDTLDTGDRDEAFNASAFIGKLTDIVTFLCAQENSHVAMSGDTLATRGCADDLFEQKYVFRYKGAGIHVTLAVHTSADKPEVEFLAEPTVRNDVTARYLAGSITKQISRLAA